MLRPYTVAGIMSIPSAHVPHVVHVHILQSDAAQHVRNARAARPFRSRWRRIADSAAWRPSVASSERSMKRAGGPHAFVLENGVDQRWQSMTCGAGSATVRCVCLDLRKG